MAYKRVTASRISAQNFRRFGRVIDFPGRAAAPRHKNLFKVIIRQPRSGWRIAYLVVRDKVIARLEQHPGSLESFEPIKGRGLLFVAARKDPEAIRCFLLDKPVILKKGIWHGIVTKGRECDVKIVENARVRCFYWPLGFKLKST